MAQTIHQRPFRPAILKALIRKDLINLTQHTYQLVGLVLPLFMSIVFTVMFPINKNNDRIMVVVYAPDDSSLLTALASQPLVEIVPVVSADAVQSELDALGAEATAGLILPADLDTAVAANQTPELTVYLNAEARNTNQARFQRYITEQIYALKGDTPPVTVNWTAINETSEPISLPNYLFITLILLGITLVSMIVPQTMLEEKEEGTLWPLMASPVTISDLLLAKAIVTLAYGLVVMLALTAFHRGWAGNWPITAAALLLTLLLMTAIGLLLGIYGKSKAKNNTLITVLILAANIPSWFAVISISSLPAVAAFLLQLLPTHYAIKIVALSLEGNATLANTAVSFIILILVTLALWGWLLWKSQDTAVLSNLKSMES